MEAMEAVEAVIRLSSLLAALGALGGAAAWCVHFLDRDRRQDKALNAIRREQSLICYGVLACLKGLKEQGCNGPVSDALNRLEKHLNQAAHDEAA